MDTTIMATVFLVILAIVSIVCFYSFFVAKKNQVLFEKINAGGEKIVIEMMRRNIKEYGLDKKFAFFIGIGAIISFIIILLLLVNDLLC